ncbi:MAG: dihydrofolate reductase family protein [Solirubrobacteraceae bacterium]
MGPYFDYGGPELDAWIHAELDKPQIIVFGRITYERLATFSSNGSDQMSQRLTALPKLVVSSTLSEPLEWANTLLLPGDAVEMMPRAKRESQTPMRTMGSVSMVSNLVDAGLVDRLRLMVFPLSCGSAGREHIFATGALKRWELDQTTVLDQRVVLLEYQMTG